MDIRKIPVFAAITQRMGWLTQRQQVLAQNIANSDTPGYRPKDIEEIKFGDLVGAGRKLKLAGTSNKHLNLRDASKTSNFRVHTQDETYGIAPNENAVVVEEQMLKVAETRIDYETMTVLYKKHIGMIRTALGR